MTTSTPTQQTEADGPFHPHMTRRQARYLVDLINGRTAEGTPTRRAWQSRYFALKSHAEVSLAIDELRAMPKVEQTAPVAPAAASKEGLYLDPASKILYRLTFGKYGEPIISVYSKHATLRRMLTDGAEVKRGTWKRMNAWNSRRALRVGPAWYLHAEWLMTDQEKEEYITGMCNFCYRGLIDSRSVKHNYGPKCAEQHNLPWGD